MDRASEIIAEYRNRYRFDRGTALDVLAWAHDQALERARQAERRAQEAEKKVESTVVQRANEITRYMEVDLQPPSSRDPTVWTFRVQPQMYEARMLCSHPSKWDAGMREDIVAHAGKHLTRLIMQAIMSDEPKSDRQE